MSYHSLDLRQGTCYEQVVLRRFSLETLFFEYATEALDLVFTDLSIATQAPCGRERLD
jgi:hypothetical protein